MKRIFSLLLAVCFVLLCGCKSEEVLVRTNNMKFDCKFMALEEKYTIDFAIDKDGSIEAKFKSPKNINELKYILKNNKVYEKFSDMNSEQEINNDNKIVLLARAIANSNKKVATEKDENFTYCGKIDNYDYHISVAPTGLPLYLEITELGYKAYFENLTLVK